MNVEDLIKRAGLANVTIGPSQQQTVQRAQLRPEEQATISNMRGRVFPSDIPDGLSSSIPGIWPSSLGLNNILNMVGSRQGIFVFTDTCTAWRDLLGYANANPELAGAPCWTNNGGDGRGNPCRVAYRGTNLVDYQLDVMSADDGHYITISCDMKQQPECKQEIVEGNFFNNDYFSVLMQIVQRFPGKSIITGVSAKCGFIQSLIDYGFIRDASGTKDIYSISPDGRHMFSISLEDAGGLITLEINPSDSTLFIMTGEVGKYLK